jgi:hypothetical protein
LAKMESVNDMWVTPSDWVSVLFPPSLWLFPRAFGTFRHPLAILPETFAILMLGKLI